MKIEDKRIIKYDSLRTNGVYDEITKTPQKYLINKVRVHHDIDRIYIRYDIEDAVIVYYFINI
jgi:Ulp1 family protease